MSAGRPEHEAGDAATIWRAAADGAGAGAAGRSDNAGRRDQAGRSEDANRRDDADRRDETDRRDDADRRDGADMRDGANRRAGAGRRDTADRRNDTDRRDDAGRRDAADPAGAQDDAGGSDAAGRRGAGGRLDEARLAVMLLTRLPAGRIAGAAPPLARAAWAFPLVGAAVGLIGGAAMAGAIAAGAAPVVAALLAVAAMALATGGLHHDGLADFADGIGGGRDRARRLEIMRDSRIGSFGVLALGLTLALTVAGMAEVAEATGGGWAALAAFVALGAVSRTAMIGVLAALPPARGDGLGHAAAGPGRPVLAVAALICALALLPLGAGAVWVALAAALAATAVGLLAWRGLGGQTGDVLGAAQVVAEAACWVTLSVVLA